MTKTFILPPKLIGRFAVVKLWPEVQAAEDECIARIKIAAAALDLECIEIHADGRLLTDVTKVITKKDVDFVLHLHYDTPKLYDAFSFVALWNPTHFYHEWGYSRCTRNLLTHDDFLSCSSPAADDHVTRLIRKDPTHSSPHFKFYHSLVDVIHPPTLGVQRLFYAGINWEALDPNKKSRHSDLLKLLDKTGELRIYGPSEFLGINVWKGFKSYVKEIPFDGISMMNEIAKVGISLVLSSQAHKDCELMSNRLFESIAAGAFVVCDENNFAKKFFGDTLLYIDTRRPVEKVCDAILEHLDWIISNKNEALNMIKKAQQIFKQHFTLRNNLSDLYLGFTERKQLLLDQQNPKNSPTITIALNLLMPEYSYKQLHTHIASVVSQEYTHFSPVMVIDKSINERDRVSIQAALKKASRPIELIELDFFVHDEHQEIKIRRNLGLVIMEILTKSSHHEAMIFVAPNEKLFSNHLQVLADCLIRNSDIRCAATAVILKSGNEPINTIYEEIDFRYFRPKHPNGYARFIFRTSALSPDLNLALPYLDRRVLAALVGENEIYQAMLSTVIIDVDNVFPIYLLNEDYENTVINDMFPTALNTYTGYEIIQQLSKLKASEYESNALDSDASLPKINSLKLLLQLPFLLIINQIKALYKEGLIKRLKAIKRKLARKLNALREVA